MKGIYLAAYKAFHPKYDIVYQDINGQRDIGGDMMQIDFVYALAGLCLIIGWFLQLVLNIIIIRLLYLIRTKGIY